MRIQTYDELLALAEKGDNSKVDTYMQSLRNEMDTKEEVKEEAFYAEMPGELPAFCFGHGAGKVPGKYACAYGNRETARYSSKMSVHTIRLNQNPL